MISKKTNAHTKKTNIQILKCPNISQKTNLLSEQNKIERGGVWWANRNPEQNVKSLSV